MKEPDVKECPTCGIEVTRKGPVPSVEPECEQQHGYDGKLIHSVLYWRCRSCGCRWQHGQFSNAQGDAQSPANNL